MEEKSSKAIRTMSFMSFIIFCAKFLGLFRETLIGSVYGQGYLSDIINTASQIPLLFFDMTLGVAILSTFVPVFNNFLLKDGRARAEKFACNFISFITLAAAVLSILGIIFSKEIVGFIANGYDEAKIVETARLLKIRLHFCFIILCIEYCRKCAEISAIFRGSSYSNTVFEVSVS